MSKPPSYELATLTALDKVTSEDDNEIIEASSSIGLYPLGPQPREDISRAPSPIPGSLDPESAIHRTTPTPSKFLITARKRSVGQENDSPSFSVIPRRFAGIEPAYSLVHSNQPTPAQHPDAPPVWHSQRTTVVVHQPLPSLAQRPRPISLIHNCENPTPTICHNCGENIVTYIYTVSGNCTYAACGILALVRCVCGCCLVPFFVDQFKDTIHKCPNCHVTLGKYRKL